MNFLTPLRLVLFTYSKKTIFQSILWFGFKASLDLEALNFKAQFIGKSDPADDVPFVTSINPQNHRLFVEIIESSVRVLNFD